MLVACMILVCNHERTEFGKPHAYRGPECAPEDRQWCGEPYFEVSAISSDPGRCVTRWDPCSYMWARVNSVGSV
jgi:hypothetical protein